MGQGDFEQEGLLSLSSHPLLYKQESRGGIPTDSNGAFRPGGKGQAEAGIWRESPGHRVMSFAQLGLPSAGFVHLAPAGFPALPPQPTRLLLLLLPWQLAAILYLGHYLISGFSHGVPGGWEIGLQGIYPSS